MLCLFCAAVQQCNIFGGQDSCMRISKQSNFASWCPHTELKVRRRESPAFCNAALILVVGFFLLIELRMGFVQTLQRTLSRGSHVVRKHLYFPRVCSGFRDGLRFEKESLRRMFVGEVPYQAIRQLALVFANESLLSSPSKACPVKGFPQARW